MKGKVVAVLETRAGAHLGDLIARRGGTPLLAPALEEVPDVEPEAVASLLDAWRANPFRMVIFQTGVGTQALFQAADTFGATQRLVTLLGQSLVVVRGPKPVGVLNSRGVRIDIRAPTPFTTETVLQAISGMQLQNAAVLVQRYGAANKLMRDALEARGASVTEVATYRWAVPQDTRPLEHLLDALAVSHVDAVVFTSAVQIENLFAVAERTGRADGLCAQLNSRIVASIGPVCSRALAARGVVPTFQADPPKLGPLVAALEVALGGHPGAQ